MWTTRFGTGSRQSFATEGLDTDNRTDHVTVYVAIANPHSLSDVLLGAVNSAVNGNHEMGNSV